MAEKPKRFGEMNRIWDDVENWAKVDDILGQEIVVHDCVQVNGKFGQYLAVRFTFDGDSTPYGFTTGGEVITKKIVTAKEKRWLPLPGKIIKEKRYYDIV